MRRLERSRVPLGVWAAIGVGGIFLAIFLGFFGTGPVGGGAYELKAMFRSESVLKPRSQVRIAGVPVGEVTTVAPVAEQEAMEESGVVEVTMELENAALPVHADATASIRSRLIFEGNNYIALNPGSPGAPQLEDGDTIGVDRTTGPVQLDRVLSDLPLDTRNNLRTVVQGLGRTLTQTDKSGETASQALNDGLADAPASFKGLAQVMDGLQGQEPGDLARLVEASDNTFAGFVAQEAALSELITNSNLTLQATASRQQELSRTVALLDPFLHNAESAFVEVERALPNTTTLARELIPGVNELPATITALNPWLSQATALLGPNEAGGLLKQLDPATRATAGFTADLIPILADLDGISRCWSKNILPTGEVVINDPPLSSGPTVEQEFFQGFTGLASAAQNFDGNGHYVRAQTGGGAYPIQTDNLPGFGISWANANLPLEGTRPRYPGAKPPINFGSDCASNARPDLNSAATGGSP